MYSVWNKARGRVMFGGAIFDSYSEACDWMMEFAIASGGDTDDYAVYPVALSGMEHLSTGEYE